MKPLYNNNQLYVLVDGTSRLYHDIFATPWFLKESTPIQGGYMVPKHRLDPITDITVVWEEKDGIFNCWAEIDTYEGLITGTGDTLGKMQTDLIESIAKHKQNEGSDDFLFTLIDPFNVNYNFIKFIPITLEKVGPYEYKVSGGIHNITSIVTGKTFISFSDKDGNEVLSCNQFDLVAGNYPSWIEQYIELMGISTEVRE